MRIQFVSEESGPERLVAQAEILFDEERLRDLKLVGFQIWRSPDGELFVTVPSRVFGAGRERRYLDFVRSVDGHAEPVRRLKSYILEEYRKSTPKGEKS